MLEASLQLTRDAFQLNAEFSVAPGEVSVLFGPSGCGKTTLVRALAGLEECAGEIYLSDTIWQSSGTKQVLPTYKRSAGVVFQNGNLFPHLTVLENLRFAERKFIVSRKEKTDSNLLNHLVELLDLRGLLNKNPSQLSGGEEQRVALGRALFSSPALLMLDEPLSAQDFSRKEGIIPYLGRIKKEWNIPILYITHNIEELHLLADALLLMEEGRIIASGRANDLLTNPRFPLALRRDAGAILCCEFDSHTPEDGLSSFKLEEHLLRVPLVDYDLMGSQRVRIAARDVSLALEKNNSSSVLNQLLVTVANVTPTDSSQTLVVLNLGRQKLLSLITSYSAKQLGIHEGMTLWAMVKGVALL